MYFLVSQVKGQRPNEGQHYSIREVCCSVPLETIHELGSWQCLMHCLAMYRSLTDLLCIAAVPWCRQGSAFAGHQAAGHGLSCGGAAVAAAAAALPRGETHQPPWAQ